MSRIAAHVLDSADRNADGAAGASPLRDE